MTPGGGVLKLTLFRKGPLKITTEAQNRRPDPSQTAVKTVYDPTKEKNPLQGGEGMPFLISSQSQVLFLSTTVTQLLPSAKVA